LDVRNIRLTAQSEPIILMEVMPAAMVASLLVMTYLVFGLGIALIVRDNLRGTSTLAAPPGGVDGCSSSGSGSSGSSGSSGGGSGSDGTDASASGCTSFDPVSDLSPLWLLSSSASLTPSATAPRYGAVFSGNFTGMTDLYGSVSLHASFANGTTLASL
ncbi:unnamed protein product, partial [Laminaria digitata]